MQLLGHIKNSVVLYQGKISKLSPPFCIPTRRVFGKFFFKQTGTPLACDNNENRGSLSFSLYFALQGGSTSDSINKESRGHVWVVALVTGRGGPGRLHAANGWEVRACARGPAGSRARGGARRAKLGGCRRRGAGGGGGHTLLGWGPQCWRLLLRVGQALEPRV